MFLHIVSLRDVTNSNLIQLSQFLHQERTSISGFSGIDELILISKHQNVIYPIFGCHTELCVTVYNVRMLNSVHTWSSGFSAMYIT
jgi:hypothetical protein